ncbi:hypothetical protein TNCV_620751 [Trichonephila clavipes]|nr:hypothetical protein TNCV_620751 [Trichonephila clavipes]
MSSMSFDLSSMSFDLSSMSLDPRVKTIFGRPLFHWTCPAFPLWMTPVSIVALGWNEKFSLGPEKSFGGKFEKFCFVHTCSPAYFASYMDRDPKHNIGDNGIVVITPGPWKYRSIVPFLNTGAHPALCSFHNTGPTMSYIRLLASGEATQMEACNENLMGLNVPLTDGCTNSFGEATKRRDLNKTSVKRMVNDSATRGPRLPWTTHGGASEGKRKFL